LVHSFLRSIKGEEETHLLVKDDIVAGNAIDEGSSTLRTNP
jgi:hypothetical protein